MENKEIVKLALDTMRNSVSGNFSAKEGSEALRQAFIEMNGGSDKLTVKSFRDHPQLFQLIEEVMPIMIQEGLRGDELAFNMVDYDKETRKLQLTSDGIMIGNHVTVPSDDFSSSSDDEWGDMEEDGGWGDMTGQGGGSSNQDWETM